MIEDFGEKIHGAAKDRWREYRNTLSRIGNNFIAEYKLTEVFPEPNYKKLLDSGVEPWKLATIRALRDVIPNKPSLKNTRKLSSWVLMVQNARSFASMVLDGEIGRTDLEERLSEIDRTGAISMRKTAYEMLGHDNSLKTYNFGYTKTRFIDGKRLDEPKIQWVVEKRSERFVRRADTPEEAIEALREYINDNSGPRKSSRNVLKNIRIYMRKNTGEVFIGRKMGRDYLDIMKCKSTAEARKIFLERPEEILKRYEQLKTQPDERRAENRERQGIDLRGGRDITSDEFLQTFGFRGVQFGNYVEGPRRQADLNRAYDALIDLSDILGCDPSSLSLGGRLGLAFGARGRGGIGAGVAHYEPVEVVINLTKTKGAGSLAHEWFHALDNIVMKESGRETSYGTGSRNVVASEKEEALTRLTADLRMNSDVYARSVNADKYRTTDYFSLPHEVAARCFEAWVIYRLQERGMHNDYLANIQSEEVFRAEAKALNHTEDRYTYPTRDEIGKVARCYETLFRHDGPISELLNGTDMLALDRRIETDREESLDQDEPQNLQYSFGF